MGETCRRNRRTTRGIAQMIVPAAVPAAVLGAVLAAIPLALLAGAAPAGATPWEATFAEAPAAPAAETSLFAPVALSELPAHMAPYLTAPRWRGVRVSEDLLRASAAAGSSVEIPLFGGKAVRFQHRKTVHNRSGSTSWVGDAEGFDGEPGDGLAVLVFRQGVVVGSIRVGKELYMLSHGGEAGLQVLHEVDESAPQYQELPPTPVDLDPVRLAEAEERALAQAEGSLPQDDGSIQDLLVVYTPGAVTEVGGVTAVENLIDLGVTETNLSYEASGVVHRLRLVHTALTDYTPGMPIGDPRDLLQDPDDGVMDEVHPLRDEVAADLVMLLLENGGGCGRAFIMNVVSPAHEEFAFCYVNHVCVSPGYTFQHELGHIQSGRHQRTSPQPDSPFTYNFGYTDPANEFRTIMAAGSSECPNGCPRRLAWSNPDVNDAQSGAPMGLPDTDPLPADMHRALNDTAFTVANFRVSNNLVFSDGFESGDTTGWDAAVP